MQSVLSRFNDALATSFYMPPLSEAAKRRTSGTAGSAANTGNPRLHAVVRLWRLNGQV